MVKGEKMKTLGKIIIVIIALSSEILSDGVTASVDNRVISTGEMVEVTIEADGENVEFPSDISGVMGFDVENISSSRQSSYQWSPSGNVSIQKSLLKFYFYPSKSMTIPEVEVVINSKKYKTKPIKIDVQKAVATKNDNNSKIKIELISSKKSAVVGEAIDVTMKLSIQNNANIMEINYIKPTFDNFEVKENKNIRKGRTANYQTQIVKYTLYPKIDGNLTISPATIKIATPKKGSARRDFFGQMISSPKWSQIVSNSINIDVKPIPKDILLVGEFKLKASINKNIVKINKPVKLNIEITGIGNLDSLEEINYDITDVNLFSDGADIKSQFNSNGDVVSKYNKSFAFIADRNFTIEAKEIKVYNPKLSKVEILKIPEYKITVEGSRAILSSNARVISANNIKPEIKEVIIYKDNPINIFYLILAFIFGVISVLFINYVLPKIKSSKNNNYNENEIFKLLYANIGKSDEIEKLVRDMYAKKAGDKSVVIDKKRVKEIVDKLR